MRELAQQANQLEGALRIDRTAQRVGASIEPEAAKLVESQPDVRDGPIGVTT